MTDIEEVADKIIEWRNNPAQFVRDNFQVEPDLWQMDVLEAFASNDPKKQRIAMRACAGPGKSAVLAWLGWNFLSCSGERGDHPKGIAISVTWDNLKDGLWTELAKWQAKSKYLMTHFTWTKTRIYANDHPETWYFSARSFNKSANSEEQGRVLSGIHSGYVLFLIDESGEIPATVLKAAEQAMSAEHFAKIATAGNPTSTEGLLYDVGTILGENWFNVAISADPDDPKRTPRVDIEWAKEQLKTYGREDPWVMSYILGQFPKTSMNTLLSVVEVEKAKDRHMTESVFGHAQKRLGIDVARFGMDNTVIFPRQGLAAFNYVVMRGARSNEIADRILQAKITWGSGMEMVDGTGGYGSGVVDSLLLAGHDPYEVHFSSKAGNNKYFNKRSEMWFEMAQWIKRGGSIPPCPQLKKELITPTYGFQNGKLKLEEKEQIKKRLGFSPDIADALALTFSIPDMPKIEQLIPVENRNKLNTDYDIFNSKN